MSRGPAGNRSSHGTRKRAMSLIHLQDCMPLVPIILLRAPSPAFTICASPYMAQTISATQRKAIWQSNPASSVGMGLLKWARMLREPSICSGVLRPKFWILCP